MTIQRNIVQLHTKNQPPMFPYVLEEGEIYESPVWELHYDPISDQDFYYCPRYNCSSYLHPSVYNGDNVVILTDGPVSWTKHFKYTDESPDKTVPYYYCKETGEETFNKPTGYVEIIREYEDDSSQKRTYISLLHPHLPLLEESYRPKPVVQQ